MSSIIEKIKSVNLSGRGGACFPVASKWEMVKKAPGNKKYVICNCSEGEPAVAKDLYLLEKDAETVIDGMKLAVEYLSTDEAGQNVRVSGFLYINEKYYDQLHEQLEQIIGDAPIVLFRKSHTAGYIGGEETALINNIEGQKVEPRLKPPYPPQHGLWQAPTLVNNVETYFDVSLASKDAYVGRRYYTITGDVFWSGVFEANEQENIENILKLSKNYPDKPFFVQVGGGASGEILNQTQLNRPATGAASLTVYLSEKHNPMDLFRKWIGFFKEESCGQCTPCREGTIRLYEILESDDPDWDLFADLLDNLTDSAFCGLGCAVPIPIKTYVANVLPNIDMKARILKDVNTGIICECFNK